MQRLDSLTEGTTKLVGDICRARPPSHTRAMHWYSPVGLEMENGATEAPRSTVEVPGAEEKLI